MKWPDAPVERRPLVVVEDHLYHTVELIAALAKLRPDLVAQTTAIALDRAGPDTDAAVADCRRQHPALLVVAAVAGRQDVKHLTTADTRDLAACARLIARHLRPGGLLVQDVQLSTLPFVPADRWWESIYLAATVRGLFADRPPQVRFLSNKRGYTATFGRDLAEAGFDPRDVMDKAALEPSVAPTIVRLVESAFPMALSVALAGALPGAPTERHRGRASTHEAERRELSSRLDLLLWIDPHGWELSGRLVELDPSARGLALRPGSHEAASWQALVTDRLDRGDGLPVVGVGERIGPRGVDRAEATNLAARHVHTLRSRLRDAGAIVTAHHAYRLRDDLDVGLCRPAG
jgi:hypothetical protein